MRTQDAFGIGLSGLCLARCLAVPVLLSIAPAFAWMENEAIHIALAALALLVTLQAVRRWPGGLVGSIFIALAWVGVGLLFFGAFAEVSEVGERVITSVGATSLAAAHLLAWRFSERHTH